MPVIEDGYVRIFDTTLRDGEQSPGATMTSDEKRTVAAALARLGVDVIEAGFPAASPDDLAAVQQIATAVGRSGDTPSGAPPIVAGLARATAADIERAWEAVAPAAHPRIHTFLATSDIHLAHKLRMSRQQVIDTVAAMVAHAHARCEDVEFSPEDAGRSDPAFLYQVLATAIEAGATTLNIPDTVGYTTPDEFGALIAGIRANTPGIERCIVSVHCHNDLGLATANSLAGVRAGARQIEVAINGIGERAGNTALEEAVMALHTRRSYFGLRTGIDTTRIARTSKLVSSVTGMVVQPNKAIVGANAFLHEAGIHQDGMLKHHETYEIMRPETVGAGQSRLVLGKHSGRHAVRASLSALGYELGDAQLDTVFTRFKNLADKKKLITDADLEALVADTVRAPEALYVLEDLQVACGTMGMPTATVRLRGPDGRTETRAAIGTGPMDAAYKAIDEIVGAGARLLEFQVQSVTAGIDALGEVTVKLHGAPRDGAQAGARGDRVPARNPQRDSGEPRVYLGHGAATDIVVAGARAYLAAVNKYLAMESSQGQGKDQGKDPAQAAPVAKRGHEPAAPGPGAAPGPAAAPGARV